MENVERLLKRTDVLDLIVENFVEKLLKTFSAKVTKSRKILYRFNVLNYRIIMQFVYIIRGLFALAL